VLYRSYLWMPGMFLLVPLLMLKFPRRRTMLISGLIAILLIPLAWNRLWTFSSHFRLWDDAALLLTTPNVSGADRIFYNRGQANAAAHQWDDAIEDFKRTAALSPQLAPVHYELGMAYINRGDWEVALEQFNASIAINPEDGRFYYGKGLALMKLHQRDPALQQLKKGCELDNQGACMLAGWMQPKK